MSHLPTDLHPLPTPPPDSITTEFTTSPIIMSNTYQTDTSAERIQLASMPQLAEVRVLIRNGVTRLAHRNRR
jgi:hypothetical protein